MKPRQPRVYFVERRSVEPPLVDGAEIDDETVGLFSSLHAVRQTLADLRRRRHWLARHEPGSVVHYRATEYRLDRAPGFVRWHLLDADGGLLGSTPVWTQSRWGGKPPETCRFRPGDVVALHVGHRYRLGVVLAQPVPPDEAARLEVQTDEKDRYLVGLVGAEGDPYRWHDHDHPLEWEMLVPPVAPDAAMAELLRQRLAGSSWGEGVALQIPR